MLKSEMYNLFIVSYASTDATLGRSRAQQPTAHSHSLSTSATTHGYICAVATAVVGCAATGCMTVLILGLVISAGESKQGGLVRQLTEDDAKLITLYLGADPS